MELNSLLKQNEGKTLEFKRDLSGPQSVLKSIVAFANTSGGTLLIGVEDKTKKLRGIQNPLELEEKLANLIVDSIHPLLRPEIEILSQGRFQILAVQVYPSASRPHYLKALGAEEGVFIRVGSTNRQADAIMRRELQRFVTAQSFDEQAMPELDSEALDFRVASELFSESRALKKSDFKSLQLVTTHQGRTVPTTGGTLLFGKNRLEHFPDAWIQAGLFQGLDKKQIIDSQEIKEYLPLAVEAAMKFVQRSLPRAYQIGAEARRREVHAVPPQALREVLMNAVLHADYSQMGAPIRVSIFQDRLEVENPGLLPFGLTLDDIQRGVSKLRNRVIGRVFQALGFIEQWGSGIPRIKDSCRAAGLDEPKFEEIGTHFRATIWHQRIQAPQEDKVDAVILEQLRKVREKGLTTQQIAEKVGRSTRTMRSRLRALVDRGLLVELGSGPNDPKRKYYLAESNR